MSKRQLIPFFLMELVVALCMLGCTDVLLERDNQLALSFVAPGASSGRAADGAAHWNVTAWLELEDGTRLQSQQTAAKAGEPVTIPFAPVAAGTRLKVKVELLSAQPPLQKYAGESEFMEVLPGEKTVRLELKLVDAESEEGEKEEPVIVNADTPTITIQPVGETKTFAAEQARAVKKELTVKASVSDDGTLTYQWYSNTSNSTTDGTPIEGATSSSYEATVNAKETKYFYCIVTNTNNNVSGAKTAAIITSVVAVASVEGELASIAAEYTGSQGYMLVGQINHNDFTVTETYTANGQSITKEVTSLDGQYTFSGQSDDSGVLYVGNVPLTITNSSNPTIQDQVIVPVKYELNVNNLTITGGDTVEQNGNLVLTAEYKADGNDVQYKLYDESGSGNTYKVIDNVTISWAGATPKDNAWEADADTKTVGSQTATVVLSTIDNEWCVTTNSIEKSHEYTVNSSSGISDENSLLEAINQAQDDEVVTITQEITVTNTIAINKNIVIEATGSGKLLRSNEGTVTGPMFEVSSSGNLTLQNITLDGQYNGGFRSGKNNPFVINNGGTLTISRVTLTNNYMSPDGYYYDDGRRLFDSAAVYSAGTTTIKDSTISEVVSSINPARGIVYGVSGSLTISGTNITLPSSYSGNALYLESAVRYNINTKTTGQLSQSSYKSVTPDSP